MFQALKDWQKDMNLINTSERILFECQLYLKKEESNKQILFLRLYESFMLFSIVFFFSFTIFTIFDNSANPSIKPILFYMILRFLFVSNIHIAQPQKPLNALSSFLKMKFLYFSVRIILI